MLSLLNEQRLSPVRAARRAGVSLPTIGRWFGRGVAGVRLESFRLGGRRFTTVEALERFVEATTAAATPGGYTPQVRTNRQREVSISRAERELKQFGI